MNATREMVEKLRPFVNRDRMVETAVQLVGVPSRTGEAGNVSERLAEMLAFENFPVERPEGGHPSAPAVALRLDSGRAGRVLQFDGHLDTVHLPFVPPAVSGDRITGSGAADMKGGIAAAVEAVRVLREADALPGGSVLFTAHDLHESPWGDGSQLDAMIHEGYVGDAVLLPEPLTDTLPVIGRGLAIWKAEVRRRGAPVHEVMRPRDEPSVISAAGALIRELDRLALILGAESDDFEGAAHLHPGKASVFIGQVHSGEIFNQYPQVCRLEGTRRWLPGADRHEVEREFRGLLGHVARSSGTTIDCEWVFTRDAFHLNLDHPLVTLFQNAYKAATGETLPLGPKPFVDDGNSFWALAGVPAITHGPRSAGQHTVAEWVSIADMERVALLYAATAVAFCAGE
jgi:acetylornithine deacetylase/succinyl-diaminopimelate desuccinylase-like protein